MAYYVYKYVYNGKIIYVGKTNNMSARTYQHLKEQKFYAYLSATIFCCELPSEEQQLNTESYLIYKYQPRLNHVGKRNNKSRYHINESCLTWSEYTNPKIANVIRYENLRKEQEERDFKVCALWFLNECGLRKEKLFSKEEILAWRL